MEENTGDETEKAKDMKDSDSNPEKSPRSTDTEAVPVLKENAGKTMYQRKRM